MAGKFYVVWNGLNTGVFSSWEECKSQIQGYPDARYKSFSTVEEANIAYRNGIPADLGILKAIVTHGKEHSTPEAPSSITPRSETRQIEGIPDNNIIKNAIAVDAACSGNPGPVEYRGVRVDTGMEVFRVGPLQGGSNNMGEYLALVHALALLDKQGDTTTPVYADSMNAITWLRRRGCRTKIERTEANKKIFELLDRADAWVRNHLYIPNPVLKWDTAQWGEIPADFGRKH